jgi:hypothetical protein
MTTVVVRAEQEAMVLSLFPIRNCSYLNMRLHYKKYGMEILDRLDNKGIWIWMYVTFVEVAHTYDIATRTMRGRAKPNFLEPLSVLGDKEQWPPSRTLHGVKPLV